MDNLSELIKDIAVSNNETYLRGIREGKRLAYEKILNLIQSEFKECANDPQTLQSK